jgi:hypothetical protein
MVFIHMFANGISGVSGVLASIKQTRYSDVEGSQVVCLNVSAKVGFNSCVVVALHARESPWAITRGNAHNNLIQLLEHLLLHLSCKSIFYSKHQIIWQYAFLIHGHSVHIY